MVVPGYYAYWRSPGDPKGPRGAPPIIGNRNTRNKYIYWTCREQKNGVHDVHSNKVFLRCRTLEKKPPGKSVVLHPSNTHVCFFIAIDLCVIEKYCYVIPQLFHFLSMFLHYFTFK